MVDLSSLINHETTKEVLIAGIAFFLRTVVGLLKKIYLVFGRLDASLKKIISQNDVIILQNKRVTDKVISIEDRQKETFYRMNENQGNKKDSSILS